MLINRNKSYKSLFNKIAVSALLVAGGMMPSSCSDDFLDSPGEYEMNPDGTFGPFDLEVALEFGQNQTQTRGNFGSTVYLENAWVGIFDSATGSLVAMMNKEYGPDKTTESTSDNHNGTAGNDFEILEFRNLMINDNNSKVYIAGVANYSGIDVMTAQGSESTKLIDALQGVTNIFDFKNIAVDVASAERAMNGKNRPLMCGFWGQKTTSNKTGHGNFTVDNNGKVQTNNTSDPEAQIFDTHTKKITWEHLDNIRNSTIHLRRLYSQVKVTVNVSDFNKFENPTVRVYNMPRYTFLQEHTTVEDASKYKTREKWLEVTPNAGSIYGTTSEPFELSDSIKNASNGEEFVMNPGDEFNVTNNGRTISFTYWHYESKHWGLPEVKKMNGREKLHPGTEVYASLSPTATEPYNDDAPYFVINADVESSDGQYTGNADFIIHEGFCCESDGDATTFEDIMARDFSTFRNTAYNYTVNLKGMKSIITKVTKEDLSGEDFYNGVGGTFWSTQQKKVSVVKKGGTQEVWLPEGELIWCISENGAAPFGIPIGSEHPNYKQYGTAYPNNVSSNINSSSTFYNYILIDGQPLAETGPFDSEGKHVLTFGENLDVNGVLYLCGVYTSTDGTTKYYTVYAFNQDGNRLDPPVVTMDKAPVGQDLILGIHDHTIFWKPVEGAKSYTITLKETGYTVTLAPGDVKTINDNWPLYLTEEPDGRLSFRVRYANTQKGMLNLVNEDDGKPHKATATIQVTANNETTSSEPGSVSRTVVNPNWDFSSAEWQAAVKQILGTATGQFTKDTSITLENLTVVGNADKLEYRLYGKLYCFKPGGKGSWNNRSFSFHAFANGKINVWTSANGSAGTGRYIIVDQTDSSGGRTSYPNDSESANASAPGTATKSGNIKIDPVNPSSSDTQPQKDDNNVFIYNSEDILFYRIQFTPQDR